MPSEGWEFQTCPQNHTLTAMGCFHLSTYHMYGGGEGRGESPSTLSKDQNEARLFITCGKVIFKWVCKQRSQFQEWPCILCQHLIWGRPQTLWFQAGLAWTPLLLRGQGHPSIQKMSLMEELKSWKILVLSNS